ncbi:hypothetical protein MTR_1g071230 [Medicago truncatula]|uniref:Uncharacterized protein n=1 Tax=Medicago truncatula TaxID=3880 RepID=G7ICQ9_MEDTR|nr:hypothetical protein MTR_1g071230 [Medicago truncatula]
MKHTAPRPNLNNGDNNQVQFPLGSKWTEKGSNYYNNPSHDTIHYKIRFDRRTKNCDTANHKTFGIVQQGNVPVCFTARCTRTTYGHADIPQIGFKKFYEDIESQFPEVCGHLHNRSAYTLPRVQRRTLVLSDEYINWYTTVCNPNLRIDYHDDHPHEVVEQEFDVELEPEYVSEPELENNNNIPPSPHFFPRLHQRFTDPSNYQTTIDPTTILPQTSDFSFLDLNTPLHQIIPPPPYTTPRNHYLPSIGSSYNDLNQPGTSYSNNPQVNNQNYNNQIYKNPHYNHPPTPTDPYPQFTPGIEYNFSIFPANDAEFGQSSLGRLSLNSIEDNQFLNTAWPTREDDLSLTLGQSSQVHNDQTDGQPIHRQGSWHQIILPIRNVEALWYGTVPHNAQKRNI